VVTFDCLRAFVSAFRAVVGSTTAESGSPTTTAAADRSSGSMMMNRPRALFLAKARFAVPPIRSCRSSGLPVRRRARHFDLPPEPRPHPERLTAYFERLKGRPSVERVLEEAAPYMKMFPG
jgi:hypothetical protein